MNHEGFKFHISKLRNGHRYYDCALKKALRCPVTAKQHLDAELIISGVHNHDPAVGAELDAFKTILKERARNETISLRTIYVEEASRHEEAAAVYSWPTAESLMRHARRQVYPVIPHSFEDAVTTMMSPQYQGRLSLNGECFFRTILHAADGAKNLVFSNHSIVDLVSGGATTMALDATFGVVPAAPPAHQLLTLHILKQNHMIPVMFVIMEKKTEAAYQVVLSYFKEQMAPAFLPLEAITDFELALQNAVRVVYGCRIVGCWFHFNQAIVKKSRRLGHERLIRENQQASRILKMIMVLPLLPPQNIREGYEIIVNKHNGLNMGMNNLLLYVERYWLTTVGEETISVYNAEYRTNNHIERFHRELASLVREAHPNFWTFIDKMILIQSRKYGDALQLDNGLTVARGRAPRYIRNNQRIRREQRNLAEEVINVQTFLERLSHSVDGLHTRFVNVDQLDEAEEDDDPAHDPLANHPLVQHEQMGLPGIPADVPRPNLAPAPAGNPEPNNPLVFPEVQDIDRANLNGGLAPAGNLEPNNPLVLPEVQDIDRANLNGGLVPAGNLVPNNPLVLPEIPDIDIANLNGGLAPAGNPEPNNLLVPPLPAIDNWNGNFAPAAEVIDLGFEEPPLEAFNVPEMEEIQYNNWNPGSNDMECDDDHPLRCTICYTNKIRCSLECGHLFCCACTTRIFNFRRGCPLCRVISIREPIIVHLTF